MELQERMKVLIQGAEIAQKSGALTLDDAYIAKQARDAMRNNVSLSEAFKILISIVTSAQKKGVYTLRDSHLLYLAIENYEELFDKKEEQQVKQNNAVKKVTKKES